MVFYFCNLVNEPFCEVYDEDIGTYDLVLSYSWWILMLDTFFLILGEASG